MRIPILKTAFAGLALIVRRPVTAGAVLSLNVLYLFGVIGLSAALRGAGPEIATVRGGGDPLAANLAPFGLSLLLFLLMLAGSAALTFQAQGLGGRGSPLAVAGPLLRQLAIVLLLAVAHAILLLVGLTLAALVSGLGQGQEVTGPAMGLYLGCLLMILAVMALFAGKLALAGPMSSADGRLRLLSAVRQTKGLTGRLTGLFGLVMLMTAGLLFVLYVPMTLITPAALPIFTASPQELTAVGIVVLVLKGAAGALLTLLWLAPGGAIVGALRRRMPETQADVFA